MKLLWIFPSVIGIVAVAHWAKAQNEEADPFGGVSLESDTAYMMGSKLNSMVIPVIHFEDTPLEDVLGFFRSMSVELDSIESNPAKKGINFVLKTSPGWGAGKVEIRDGKEFSYSGGSPRITLMLQNTPMGEALRYAAELAGLEVQLEGYAVVLRPPAEDVESLIPALVETTGRLTEAKDEGLYEGISTGNVPLSLMEALQSEYRVLRFKEDRLIGQGVTEEDPRRVAASKKLELTRRKIEEARNLLLDYLRKEKKLAEGWAAEMDD